MRRTSGRIRKAKQKLRRRYTCDREDRQLAGDEPTVPGGAVRNEVAPVAPDPPLPHLVRVAIKHNWATPDCNKPAIIACLLEPFYSQDVDAALLVKCARVLLLLDQTQYERDRLEEAGNAKGGGGAVAVSVQANVQAVVFLNEMIERGD